MSEQQVKGLLVVLSSPSGGGKNTVIGRLLAKGHPRYRYSISMTTRPMRSGDVDGKDYFFVTPERFRQAIADHDLVEYEEVHGCFYGTPKSILQQWLFEGLVVFMDLDVHGALALKELFREECLTIFLKPPDMATLIERLKARKTENLQQIEKRLQRIPEEMNLADRFDHIVVNDDLDRTVAQVDQLLQETLRKKEIV